MQVHKETITYNLRICRHVTGVLFTCTPPHITSLICAIHFVRAHPRRRDEKHLLTLTCPDSMSLCWSLFYRLMEDELPLS